MADETVPMLRPVSGIRDSDRCVGELQHHNVMNYTNNQRVIQYVVVVKARSDSTTFMLSEIEELTIKCFLCNFNNIVLVIYWLKYQII